MGCSPTIFLCEPDCNIGKTKQTEVGSVFHLHFRLNDSWKPRDPRDKLQHSNLKVKFIHDVSMVAFVTLLRQVLIYVDQACLKLTDIYLHLLRTSSPRIKSVHHHTCYTIDVPSPFLGHRSSSASGMPITSWIPSKMCGCIQWEGKYLTSALYCLCSSR